MAYTRTEPMPVELIGTGGETLSEQLGATTEDPPADLADPSGLNGLLRWIANKLNATISAIKVKLVDDLGNVLVPVTPGAKTTANSTPVTTAIDETKLIPVAVTLDTSGAYADGDLLFESTVVPACVKADNATGYLLSVLVIGEDDQGQPFDLYVHESTVDWGALNAAPTISDADARTLLGRVQITLSDYYDLGGVRVAYKECRVPVKPAADTDDVYITGITRGTPTHTAAGMRLKLGFGS